jgi:AraC family transcriptional regulator of adaptative response / DNA-3-methyladenine glycosylase II
MEENRCPKMASALLRPDLPSNNMQDILGLSTRALDRARISRDPRFDGKFFVAVTSTGIYCRPICRVREAKRTNVRYYASAAAAAAAGYRPCLRCHPEAAPGSPAWMGTSTVVRRALRLIDEGALDDGTVEDLASKLGMGARHLDRLFNQHIGASPVAVAQTRRLHFAKRLLNDTDLAITEIALASGFGSLRRFNTVFRDTYARSPRELRKARRSTARLAEQEIVLKLAYRAPYHWRQVQEFFAARAVPGMERVQENEYARTVRWSGGAGVIHIRHLAGEHALELRVPYGAAPALLQISSTTRRVFDLEADPARVSAAFKPDALLRALTLRHPGIRIPGAWDGFECGVRAIVGQQISVAGARTLMTRLISRCGESLVNAVDDLSHLFPTPAALASADLSDVGLTGAKRSTLRAFSQAVHECAVDFTASTDDVFASLTSLPGIGTWTAQYIALRALAEPDALLDGDLVLRQMASDGTRPLSARELGQRAENWRPWRGYAAMHLWYAASERRRERKQDRSRSAAAS